LFVSAVHAVDLDKKVEEKGKMRYRSKIQVGMADFDGQQQIIAISK
jgi:hypothetical protein